MLRRISILVVVMVAVLAGPSSYAAIAHTMPVDQRASDACRLQGKEKVVKIARALGKHQVSSEIAACYQKLTDEEKAQAFEEMAREQGTLPKLLEEARRKSRPAGTYGQGDFSAAGIAWQQLIERTPFSAVGKTLRSVLYSYSDTYCDGDGSDVDYTFVVTFPYPITNPDALRSFAGITGTDLMLSWYQVKYGGINGRGNTTNGYAYLCIGDTGLATAGGEATVRNELKLHD